MCLTQYYELMGTDEVLATHQQELRRGTIVLACLLMLRTPGYGYALLEHLEAAGFEVDANTLYPLLRRLERQGLLRSEWNTDEARPRKYYSTTPTGQDLARALRAGLDATGSGPAGPGGRCMMSDLTDRYVGEVLRGVPAPMRDDVERELRASIADAIEATDARGVAQPGPGNGSAPLPGGAEAQALNELGDPARLAASLTDGPQYLIGPGLYWDYRRTVRALLMIVPPTVALTVSTVQAFTGTPPIEVLLDGLGLLLMVAFQVVLWTTLGFAIAEHTGTREIPGRRPWSVADLPRRSGPEGDAGRDRSAPCWACSSGSPPWSGSSSEPGSRDSGEVVPLLDPELWSFWLPALIALMSAGVALQLLAYARGRWSPTTGRRCASLGTCSSAWSGSPCC